jgi:MFS family permease
MLVICRALQGLALAAFLPSGMMILGSVYRPGPRKNLVFSVYGACAALGFFVGIFFSGLCGRFLSWRWYFFIGGILAAVTAATSFFSIPSDFAERRKGRKVGMDWLGAGLLVPGLVFLVFAIAGSAHGPRQWATVYIDVCLVLGVVLLAVFVYVEGWVVADPLVTADVFAVKYMKPLLFSLVSLYGSLGIFLLYGAL